MLRQLISLFFVCLVLVMATGAQAITVSVVSNADTWTAANDTGTYGTLDYMVLQGGNSDRTGYVRFDLSTLNVLRVESATLTLTVQGAIPKPPYRNDTVVTGRFSLYGMNNVAGNTPQNWSEATLNSGNTGGEMAWATGTVVVDGGRATDLDGDIAGITETITNAAAGGVCPGHHDHRHRTATCQLHSKSSE